MRGFAAGVGSKTDIDATALTQRSLMSTRPKAFCGRSDSRFPNHNSPFFRFPFPFNMLGMVSRVKPYMPLVTYPDETLQATAVCGHSSRPCASRRAWRAPACRAPLASAKT